MVHISLLIDAALDVVREVRAGRVVCVHCRYGMCFWQRLIIAA